MLLGLAAAPTAGFDTPAMHFDFEGENKGYLLNLGATPSDEPSAVIAGKRSLLADTRMLWYELVDGRSFVRDDREQTFGLLHSGDWSEKPAYRFFLSKLRK